MGPSLESAPKKQKSDVVTVSVQIKSDLFEASFYQPTMTEQEKEASELAIETGSDDLPSLFEATKVAQRNEMHSHLEKQWERFPWLKEVKNL